ncbi:hypothetical protein JAO29_05855 [Edaphobacter sp. HDX4]|uniref:hypothetical protein n=1 Tax=Edaphobacter sp. HDX4 TaxID=2794064 RepID=UPI002FE6A1C2
MPRIKQPKKPVEPAASVEERLAAALSAKSDGGSDEQTNPALPNVGDQVILRSSGTTYLVTAASSNGREVNLSLPGTNLERYRVSVDDLEFLGQQPAPSKPAEPEWDPEEGEAHVEKARRSSLEQMDAELSELTRYLKTEGTPHSVSNKVNKLGDEIRAQWQEFLDRLPDLLKERS